MSDLYEPIAAVEPHPDAELLSLLEPLRQRHRAWVAVQNVADETPDDEKLEESASNLLEALGEIEQKIYDLDASTFDGLAVKAEMALRHVTEHGNADEIERPIAEQFFYTSCLTSLIDNIERLAREARS